MLPFQKENRKRKPGYFPKSVYRLLIIQTEVCVICPFVYEETNRSYPFANGLKGQRTKRTFHLCSLGITLAI